MRRVLSPLLRVSVCRILKHSCHYFYLLAWSVSRTTWLRRKASKAWRYMVASSEGKRLKEEQTDLADQYLATPNWVRDRDLAFITLSDG